MGTVVGKGRLSNLDEEDRSTNPCNSYIHEQILSRKNFVCDPSGSEQSADTVKVLSILKLLRESHSYQKSEFSEILVGGVISNPNNLCTCSPIGSGHHWGGDQRLFLEYLKIHAFWLPWASRNCYKFVNFSTKGKETKENICKIWEEK